MVTIFRSKGSEPEYVVILAEKILKPIMKGILQGDSKIITMLKDVKKSASVKGKLVNRYKCPHCDKRSYSKPGLKGHITKMDAWKSKTTSIEDFVESDNSHKRKMSKEEHEKVISKEASKVVDQILDDILCLDDEVDILESDVTLEEGSIPKETEETKKYFEICKACQIKYLQIENT